MPARKRPRAELTDDWSELQLRFDWPEQGSYELNSKKLKPLDANKVVDHDRVSVAEYVSNNTTTASSK